METEHQVEYYAPSGVGVDQLKLHANKVFYSGTAVLIHIHAKGNPCTDLCSSYVV